MEEDNIPELIRQLQDRDYEVHRKAADMLIKIGLPAVPALIATLQGEGRSAPRDTTEVLVQIGVPAVPALMEALKVRSYKAHRNVFEVLARMGSPTLPAIMEARKAKEGHVRGDAIKLLGQVGDDAIIPILLESLKDNSDYVRYHAAVTLWQIGDSETLPRKILAETRFSVQKRVQMLDELRRVFYLDPERDYRFKDNLLRYSFFKTRHLCKIVLTEEDEKARQGAQAVLQWLNGERELLHPAQRDPQNESQELLRVAQASFETQPETLLQATSEPPENSELPSSTPHLWQRLFKRKPWRIP